MSVEPGGGVSRFRGGDLAYLYVTGIFAVVISLVPVFRGVALFPWMIPVWAVMYLLYRSTLIPERYMFLLNWLFLGVCYLGLGSVAETFQGTFHGMDVHRLETGLFGVLPSRWLQERLVQSSGCGNWFDYPLALCHSMFFFFPVLTPWLVLRKSGTAAMKRTATAFAMITTAGYATYILWPLTPPWLLAAEGSIEPLRRCVFQALQEITPGFLVSGASNTPRAAMPSLHAGVTLLMAMIIVTELGWKKGWWSVVLLAVICFEIVYGAEHFVIDIIAGYIFAAAAFLLSRCFKYGFEG